jgi:hypothetical protein
MIKQNIRLIICMVFMISIVQIFAELGLIYEFLNGLLCISLCGILVFLKFRKDLRNLQEPVVSKHRKTKWELND